MVSSTDTTYGITISISPETVQTLSAGGFSLCMLKAISTTVGGGGQPLFWLVTKQFATTIELRWKAQYEAYVSRSNDLNTISASAPITYGQVFHVQPNGTDVVTDDGLPGAMSILNTTATQYTSGLSAQSGTWFSPVAAFPLYGNMVNAFAPVEQALLMFTTYPAVPGNVAERSYAQGLLVDFGTAPDRVVTFDVNNGWSWDGGPWAQAVPPNSQLAPLLIHHAQL
jgi:hypothetical protein